MKVYNTLTRKIEEFISNDKNKVKMYTCGPTVYHYAHIGNLRTYIFEDVLEKTLEFIGYEVNRVMNITDVGHLQSDADTGEDKMLLGAKRENKTVYEIADYYTKCFFEDASKLNIRKPSIVAKASDNIDEYIKIIDNLLDNGYAYKANNNIYFDTSKLPNYYDLTNMNKDDLQVGVRIEEDIYKKNPFDFVLWFTTSKFGNQDMKWDSKYGYGYPGWHIECSGIAIKYLGEYIDIHCGGVDNIFPHHTNEIAQSESYIGHKWCNYWMHGAHLNDVTGKMSKSKGEFLTVSLLEKNGYNPLAYRYFCLNSHYQSQLVFTYESLDIASVAYSKLKEKVQSLSDDGILDGNVFDSYIKKFSMSLEDNLNTSNALTVLYEVLKDSTNDVTKKAVIKKMDEILSLSLFEEVVLDNELKEKIEKLIDDRRVAKLNKDYVLADSIRNKLREMNVEIKDEKDNTIWRLK